jgi:hypothetical protein
MNSLYNLGLRQTASIQADVDKMIAGDSSAALQGTLPAYSWSRVDTKANVETAGQISASLSALSRTIDDYDSMAKREMIKAKQEKAVMFVRHSSLLHLPHLSFIPGVSKSSVQTIWNSSRSLILQNDRLQIS